MSDGENDKTFLDYPKDLFIACGELTMKTTWHCIRYLLPFVIYPIIVYFTKLAMHFGAETSGGVALKPKNSRYYDRQFQQATLVTWTFKVIILIFVFFSALDTIGIKTNDMLEITTVFSLGLSWSMRDWLASMWGCFMIAFCTPLTKQSKIKMTAVGPVLEVIAPGLMFVKCKVDDEYDIYLPNSTLVAQGFQIAS